MKRFSIIMIILSLGIALFAFPVKITSWQIKEDLKKLDSIHASIDYVNADNQTIIAYVPDETGFQRILSNGFNAVKIPDLAKETAAQETRDGTRSYYTLEQYHAFMQATANQYPSICQLVQFGTTVQNRPLYFLKISDNVTQQENEPEFRYISSMHGDELVGFEMCIRLIQLLTSQYTTNTRISNIVNNTEMWICPLMNPDGFVAVERYNANGADINRNFAMPVGSLHPDGMDWQPETLALMNHMNEHSLNLSANFHGGALVTNYLWDYTYTRAPDNDLLIQGALTYANTNLPMHNSSYFENGITDGADWYIVNGSLSDWGYYNRDVMDFTIELSENKIPPSSQLDTFWSQNQESMLAFLEFVQKGLHGTVTNSLGQPLDATIHINSPGIDITTDPDVGDYHRMLLPGTYTVTASAAGYTTVSAVVVIPLNGIITHDFVLPNVVLTDFSGCAVNMQGNIVPNATVSLVSGTLTHSTITDTDGNFLFEAIPAGEYLLNITATDYSTYNSTFVLNADSNHQIVTLIAPLFYDGFENGLSSWTVQSPWGIQNQAGNNFLTDSPSGNYANNISLSAKLANPVSLLNITNPQLSFDIIYHLENNYDFLYVQASSNGTNWTNLTQFTGTGNTWQTTTLSLSDYIGMNFYLRFLIDSDTNQAADGVYLDNILITGLPSQQTVYGDTDANLMMNLSDVINVMEYSIGHDPIPLIDAAPWEAFRFEAADVDNDNQITATDAYYMHDKFNQYNNAFPAQGGAAYAFQNPNLSFQNLNSEIRINSSNPEYLKSLSLTFSSATQLSFQTFDWQMTSEQALAVTNMSDKSCALIILPNAQIQSLLVRIPYLTLDNTIHCAGMVNDIPIETDITLTAISDPQTIPAITALDSNYPNPFNPETTIRFTLSKQDTNAKLAIYNVKGQEVKTLFTGDSRSGSHLVKWNGTDNQNHALSNGIYFYRLSTPNKTLTNKMIMLK